MGNVDERHDMRVGSNDGNARDAGKAGSPESPRNVFVDTELWVYSLKRPDKKKYPDEALYNRDMQKHLDAKSFFKHVPPGTFFFFTTHQVCELYHVLMFRGTKLDGTFVREYINSLSLASTTRIIEVSTDVIKQCVNMSLASGIHVWDYLCIVPIIDKVDAVYTSDKHFLHASITGLGKPVKNPIGTWDEL